MLRLADLCVPLVLESVQKLEAGVAVFEPQDATLVTLAPKIPRDSGVIDWSASSHSIDCHIRAMQPWPKASSVLQRRGQAPLRCIVLQVATPDLGSLPTADAPGRVQEHQGKMLVSTGDGWLEILKLQPEGRKAVDGRSFVNGYPLEDGDGFVDLRTAGKNH